MAWRDWGNPPINSTGAGFVSNPSTSDLVAEIDSTQLATILSGGQSFMVTWVLGGSTTLTWRLEQVLSTGLGSTAVRDLTLLTTPTGQSGQYTWTYKLEKGDRLRALLNSSVTATAYAKIIAEPLT